MASQSKAPGLARWRQIKYLSLALTNDVLPPSFFLPPMALTCSPLHCFCLHVRSKVRATGRAHREKKRLIRHCLLLSLLLFAYLAPWWRWKWVEVHSQSAITSRWKLASKKVYFPQKPHIMMVPPEHTVVVKLITANRGIISVSFYANSYHWRSVIKILMKTLEISKNNKHSV